jgi:hypothetical protein
MTWRPDRQVFHLPATSPKELLLSVNVNHPLFFGGSAVAAQTGTSASGRRPSVPYGNIERRFPPN